jgi:hypothetical protein
VKFVDIAHFDMYWNENIFQISLVQCFYWTPSLKFTFFYLNKRNLTCSDRQKHTLKIKLEYYVIYRGEGTIIRVGKFSF